MLSVVGHQAMEEEANMVDMEAKDNKSQQPSILDTRNIKAWNLRALQ